MRRRFTFLTAALALLVTLAIPMGVWGQTRIEESLVALTFPDDNSSNNGLTSNQYTSTWTAMIGDYSWSISNFNNNNWNNDWTYIKCGSKNNASVASITNSAKFAESITKVELTIDAITTSKVNTIKLLASSDGSTWVEKGSFEKNIGTKTVTLDTPTADLFYKIEFDCEKGSSNGLVTVSKVEYYYNTGGNPTCATPTFSPAAGGYTSAQTVSISCATQGATIYYTTDDQDPTTSSSVYSSPINVSSDMTIKAMATANGYDNSAIATAAYTIVTLDHAGTLEDPYTVADARAAIDANVGTQGVYATGIVSAIPTAWSSQYNNITFNFVDEQGDENFLQAYRCVSTDNADASTVAVGDIVVVYGNLTYYASSQTYEFGQGCQLVSLTSSGNPSITADDVNIAADATTGSIAYTVNNPATNGSMAAVTASDWLTLGVGFESPIAFTCTANTATSPRTATVTLTYTYNTNQTVTKEVTVTQAAYEAPHVTWDLSIDQTATATEDEMTWTSDYATMGVAKAHASTNTNNYYPGTEGQSYTSTRFYKNSELTIAPAAGYAITSVVFTATTSGYASALQGSTWTNATAEVNNTTVTVTPTDGTTDIFAVIGGTCGFTSVTVYYVVNNAPSITANNVEITYDTDGDEIEFVINNPVSGGSLVASTESDWLEVGDDTYTSENGIIEFSCSVNQDGTPRTATVTLTYTYNRATVTKDVTVTQAGNPNTTMTIAEVRAQGTGDVVTTGIVTSCFGTTGYIQDATAAICVYGVSLTVGDEIRVSGTLSTYHGLLEIGSNNSTPTVTVLSNGNTVSPTPKTIAEINDDDYTLPTSIQGLYVTIEEATVTDISGQNTTIAQGENTIVVRGIYSNVSYNVNDVLTLDGNIGCFDAAQIANPQNVVVQPATEPSITVNPDTVDATAEGGNGTLTVTYQNITDITANVFFCDAEGAAATYTWITAEVNDDDNVEYTINANSGEARTAYLKVNVGETYSNLVTINQAAYVVPPTPGEWVLTNLADLTENDVFVIVGTFGLDSYAMTNDNGAGNPPMAVEVSVVDNTLSGEIANNLQWNISGNASNGYTFYPNGNTDNWLYCTNTNNGVRVGTNENKTFTFVDGGETEAEYLFNTATSRYLGIYLTNLDWRCYTSINNNITGQTFAFYKKVTSSQTTTQTVALSAGTNWFSTNLDITLADLQNALLAALDNARGIKITSQTNGTSMWTGSAWRGTIEPFDVSQHFVVLVPDDCEIELEGSPINPASHTLSIVPGNNWIAFPLSQAMSVTDAFAGFPVRNDRVSSQTSGFTTFNGSTWRGNLNTLEPGKGYIYNSASSENRTYTFPVSSAKRNK